MHWPLCCVFLVLAKFVILNARVYCLQATITGIWKPIWAFDGQASNDVGSLFSLICSCMFQGSFSFYLIQTKSICKHFWNHESLCIFVSSFPCAYKCIELKSDLTWFVIAFNTSLVTFIICIILSIQITIKSY